MNSLKNFIKTILLPKIPARISKNFRDIDSKAVEEIATSLKQHYFSRQIWGDVKVTAESWLFSDEGKMDLKDHLSGRLNSFRRSVIPWLNEARPLLGAKILEIGCGTGASTVALAEQGANVVAVDIDEESMAVARDRCRVYGLDCKFYKASAVEIQELFLGQQFDFIIFFASLEHMTVDERISAIKNSWDMLAKGGLWCVIETPNRLWYHDSHTSRLPFYLWLPDELAFKYSKFSPRQPFCKSYSDSSDDAMLSFLRHGRGVSYHEFDLAIKKTEDLDVLSSLQAYQRQTNLYKCCELIYRIATKKDYESYLAEVGPKIHRGFYEPYLNLIIRKD